MKIKINETEKEDSALLLLVDAMFYSSVSAPYVELVNI